MSHNLFASWCKYFNILSIFGVCGFGICSLKNAIFFYGILPIEGDSMQPGLNPMWKRGNPRRKNQRDYVLVLPVNRCSLFSVKRGDIICFFNPRVSECNIKRMVAVEGDIIRTLRYRDDFVRIPKNFVWVEGDNHSHMTLDSNSYGPVSTSRIYGKAVAIIYPFHRFAWTSSISPPEVNANRVAVSDANDTFNSVRTCEIDRFYRALEKRSVGTPLITVSNHTSCMDDPLIWSCLKWKHVRNNTLIRWTLTAHEICFTNRVFNWFFSRGKCVPIVRGDGVYQKPVEFIVEQLNFGDWVHIFPEGGVNMDGKPKRLKWGVGRMIIDSAENPIVIPIWHVGMNTVLPNVEPYIPRIRKNVTILFGHRMDFSTIRKQYQKGQLDALTARKIITDAIQAEMANLKQRAEQIHEKFNDNNSNNTNLLNSRNTDRANLSNLKDNTLKMIDMHTNIPKR